MEPGKETIVKTNLWLWARRGPLMPLAWRWSWWTL